MAINVGFLQPILLSSILQSVIYSSGTTPVLDLNFLSSSLPAGLTFSRASAATDIINGVLTSFASGVARISTANGYLSEPARTNLAKNDNSVATAGTLVQGATDPAGAALAYTYTESASSTGQQWSIGAAQVAYASGTTYSASVFLKAGTCDRVQLFLSSSVLSGGNGYANFYLNGAGSVTATGAEVTLATIQSVGNGWYRCNVTFTANNSATHTFAFSTLLTGSETRAPTILGTSRTVYYFGPQVEVGAWFTSYIYTTTATVTRAADVAYYVLPSTLNASAVGATLYVKAKLPYFAYNTANSGGNLVSTRTTATGGDSHFISRVTYDNRFNGNSQIGYSTHADTYPSATPAALSVVKAAYAVKANYFQSAVNGTASSLDSAGTCADIDRVYIGSNGDASAQCNSYIHEVKLFSVNKTQAQIQALTAPFSPLELGPALWLDASDAATITQVANVVSQWSDKSGNANHATQGVGANQPTTNTRTINSLNVIDFDGSTDTMAVTLATVQNVPNGNNTNFIVYTYDTGALFRPFSGTDASSRRFGFYADSTSGPGFIHALNGTRSTTGGGLSTSPQINLGVRSGTSVKISKNGGTYTSNSSAISFIVNSMSVGNGANSNGAIAEIISYPTELTSAQINQVGNYLATKWGITWTNF